MTSFANSGRIETLRLTNHADDATTDSRSDGYPESWWARYSDAVLHLPATTRAVVESDARYIASQAIPHSKQSLDQSSFGLNRVRTGIVVGSVQSGKTASMLAVAALLLDQKVDIVVVLAGTRIALWLQTYERLLNQLDGSDLFSAWKRNQLRALVPQPEDILASSDRVDPGRYLLGARNKVRAAIAGDKPVIFVVPKEDDHLLALGRFLEAQTSATSLAARTRPTTMVVLDDEADDASVLDAIDGSKITPKFIQQLWSSTKTAPATRHDRLFATYIAYTATPQANYLQQTHNPLAPRDFNAALRVPGDLGATSPRSTTYTESEGLRAYYTGGDFYYERFRSLSADPCVSYPFPEPADPTLPNAPGTATYEATRWQMIGDALRSYFVAGAARLLLGGRVLPAPDIQAMPEKQLKDLLPQPHSMLYHPSSLKDDQFAGAADIVRWSNFSQFNSIDNSPQHEIEDREFQLDAIGLTERLTAEESKWEEWLDKFKSTAIGLSTIPGASQGDLSSVTWAQVKFELVNSIFPRVEIRVLNSDPRAADRPEFAPRRVADNEYLPPRDIYTIFVAGNVLSRGLTVEGLCTSLFLRSAKEPAADTQMQMQRWFGYRGKYFAFCKVFAFSDQLALFRQYHNNDRAMKSEIMAYMDKGSASFGHGVLVLQGEAFKATSKVESKRVPLHPGPTPSIRLFEPVSGERYSENLNVLSTLLQKPDWEQLNYPSGSPRGLIKSSPMSMLEVADILDSLRYSAHDPDLSLELSRRWVSLQQLLALPAPLFRPPGHQSLPMSVEPSSCPYSIAAYLRLWEACLLQPSAPGFMPTDNPSMPWNLLNITTYRQSAPKFYIGIRFGSAAESKTLTFKGQSLPMMRRGLSENREDMLATLWGSRNPTEKWLGDQLFDYHFHNISGAPKLLSDGAWRPRGHPGLVLFHIVVDPTTMNETIAVGLAIPHGGPDHVAALRGTADV